MLMTQNRQTCILYLCIFLVIVLYQHIKTSWKIHPPTAFQHIQKVYLGPFEIIIII